MNHDKPFRLYNTLLFVAGFLAIAFFLIVFTTSCRKDSFNTEQIRIPHTSFFDLPENAPVAIKRVAAEFERQNRITGFIKDFVAQEGMPVWEKSIITYPTSTQNTTAGFDGGGGFEQGDTVVITPFVIQDSNVVTSFVVSRLNDSTLLNLYRDNDYDRYPYGNIVSDTTTADKIAFQLLALNELVFGHRTYELKDTALFAKLFPDTAAMNPRTVSLSTEEPHGLVNSLTGVYYLTLCFVSTNSFTGFAPGENNFVHPGCVTIPMIYEDYDWPSDDGGVPPEMGGGGVEAPATNCTGVNNCSSRSRIIEGRLPCGSCGTPPIIVIPPENPNHEDDVAWLYQNLLDTTTNPCIDSTLVTLRAMDTTVPQLIRSFFGESPAFKMVIGTEYYDTWDILGNNTYGAPRGGKTIDNTMSDTFQVKINTYYNKATNLATAATIIHEAVHCQLLYWFRHLILQNDTAAATQVARNFGWVFTKEISGYNPAYHDIIMINPPTEHHHAMADHFIALMARALQNFGLKKGINAPYSYYEKIAWSGLLDSRAFKALSANRRLSIEEAINAEKDPNSSLLNPYTSQPINYENTTPKGRSCP